MASGSATTTRAVDVALAIARGVFLREDSSTRKIFATWSSGLQPGAIEHYPPPEAVSESKLGAGEVPFCAAQKATSCSTASWECLAGAAMGGARIPYPTLAMGFFDKVEAAADFRNQLGPPLATAVTQQ